MRTTRNAIMVDQQWHFNFHIQLCEWNTNISVGEMVGWLRPQKRQRTQARARFTLSAAEGCWDISRNGNSCICGNGYARRSCLLRIAIFFSSFSCQLSFARVCGAAPLLRCVSGSVCCHAGKLSVSTGYVDWLNGQLLASVHAPCPLSLRTDATWIHEPSVGKRGNTDAAVALSYSGSKEVIVNLSRFRLYGSHLMLMAMAVDNHKVYVCVCCLPRPRPLYSSQFLCHFVCVGSGLGRLGHPAIYTDVCGAHGINLFHSKRNVVYFYSHLRYALLLCSFLKYVFVCMHFVRRLGEQMGGSSSEVSARRTQDEKVVYMSNLSTNKLFKVNLKWKDFSENARCVWLWRLLLLLSLLSLLAVVLTSGKLPSRPDLCATAQNITPTENQWMNLIFYRNYGVFQSNRQSKRIFCSVEENDTRDFGSDGAILDFRRPSTWHFEYVIKQKTHSKNQICYVRFACQWHTGGNFIGS